jgi:hemerythrin-like domain-containing protein
MKATLLLEKQHEQVDDMLKKLESAKMDAPALLSALANELVAHMTIEQTIFYPAVRTFKEELVLESYEEHAIAELALKRLIATDHRDDTFVAKVRTLRDLIKRHVKQEEADLFPKVEKELSDLELRKLGEQMKAAFDQVVAQGYEAALPMSYGATSADTSNKPAKKEVVIAGNSSALLR